MNAGNTAYFDNAATSFPKPQVVYDFADQFYRTSGANVGRGQYRMASRASALLEEDRELLLDLFHCPGKQAVFTPSPTIALNCIILGMGLKEGDTAYITPFEHNSVLRPLRHLEESKGVTVRTIPFEKGSLRLDSEAMMRDFDEHAPALVVVTHVSNVCGLILPIERICRVAKDHGALTVVDMSQSAGLIDTNLASDTIDFAVFAGHKTLLGPFGISGFIASQEASLDPILFGGNGLDSINLGRAKNLRAQTEVGSLDTYAVAGLNAALKWVIPRCHSGEQAAIDAANRNRLVALLTSHDFLVLHGESASEKHAGIVSVSIEGYSSIEFGKILDERGVMARAGLHCAPLAHKFLHTSPGGTVRLSIGPFSGEDDYRVLEGALDFIGSAI